MCNMWINRNIFHAAQCQLVIAPYAVCDTSPQWKNQFVKPDTSTSITAEESDASAIKTQPCILGKGTENGTTRVVCGCTINENREVGV